MSPWLRALSAFWHTHFIGLMGETQQQQQQQITRTPSPPILTSASHIQTSCSYICYMGKYTHKSGGRESSINSRHDFDFIYWECASASGKGRQRVSARECERLYEWMNFGCTWSLTDRLVRVCCYITSICEYRGQSINNFATWRMNGCAKCGREEGDIRWRNAHYFV